MAAVCGAIALLVPWLLHGWVGFLVCAGTALPALLFLVALVLPDQFRRGVRAMPDGFEVWRPLRRPVVIRYGDIRGLAVVAHGCDDPGNAMVFHIITAKVRIRVPDIDLHGTSVLDHLYVLPGFSGSAYQEALNVEVTGLHWLTGRRFVLLGNGD